MYSSMGDYVHAVHARIFACTIKKSMDGDEKGREIPVVKLRIGSGKF